MSEERPPLSDDDLEREADRILAAVEGILDRNQRSYAISCKFRRFSTAEMVELFSIIMRRARLKEPRFQDGFRGWASTWGPPAWTRCWWSPKKSGAPKWCVF